MTAYSHSRLSTFEQCPLKFKYQYIDRIAREEDSIEAFMGSRFHDVMEKVYAERAFWHSTADDLENLFNELWEKKFNEHVFITRNDRTADDYRHVGLKAVADYHRRYAPFQDGRVLGIEKRVSAEFEESGHSVFGFIDRLMEIDDGCYEIHDYKTSASLPDQSKLDEDRQLALYEIAVRRMWPHDVQKVDLVWHYVVFDKELRSRRTPEQLERLKSDTVTLIDTIERTTEFAPCESNLCRWCSYANICPLFAHEFGTSMLPPNKYLADDGVKLVNRLAELDARKRELKADIALIEEEEALIEEAAIERAAQEGVTRFVGSERQLTIRGEIEVVYPASKTEERAALEDALKEMGLWDRVSAFTAYAFKTLARTEWSREGVPAKIAEYVQLVPKKIARLSRRKDEEPAM